MEIELEVTNRILKKLSLDNYVIRNCMFSNELWFLISQIYRFKNVIFEISPTEEVGDFEVKAKFMGVQMETFMLHYQVRTILFNNDILSAWTVWKAVSKTDDQVKQMQCKWIIQTNLFL